MNNVPMLEDENEYASCDKATSRRHYHRLETIAKNTDGIYLQAKCDKFVEAINQRKIHALRFFGGLLDDGHDKAIQHLIDEHDKIQHIIDEHDKCMIISPR